MNAFLNLKLIGVHSFVSGSTIIFLVQISSSFSQSYSQSLGLLGCETASRKAIIYTQDNTDINASSGIQTHDPSVRAVEDSQCLRPRGRCD
jgi:hypothetical protein